MRQPIICFEGPSGVGKTTLCAALKDAFNIVPEVNLLFERTGDESKLWYYGRQIDRYQRCVNAGEKSILDGDVFQPIWYNWVCGYPTNFATREATHRFYVDALRRGMIRFPDLYIIFHCELDELRRRKEADITRRRRNFEKHLKIIEPLKTYYRFLDKATELRLEFIEYTDVETVRGKVLSIIKSHPIKEIDQLKTFEQIEGWIVANG